MSAKVPKNIRFRPDQIAALESLQTTETDFSALVRTAVDKYLSGSSLREEPGNYSAVRKLSSAAKRLVTEKKKQKRKQAAPKKSGAA